ncbi:MAG: hypothetical protein LBH03_06055 [Holophagales bacterium]|jgi:hypothetical protein|nr:hypothetical protein [Holophagales bacterium]
MFASIPFSIVVTLLPLGVVPPIAAAPAVSVAEQTPAQPKLHPVIWVNRQINEWLTGWRATKHAQVIYAELYINDDSFVQSVLQSIHTDYLPKDNETAVKYVKSLINSAWTLAFNKIADSIQNGTQDSIQSNPSYGNGMTPFAWIDQQVLTWQVDWRQLSCGQLPPLDDFIGDYSFIFNIWAILDPSFIPLDATDYIMNMIASAYFQVQSKKCAPPPSPNPCTVLNNQLSSIIREIESLQTRMGKKNKDIDYYKLYLPRLISEHEKNPDPDTQLLIDTTMIYYNNLMSSLENDALVLLGLQNAMQNKINELTMSDCEILHWI